MMYDYFIDYHDAELVQIFNVTAMFAHLLEAF